MVVTPVLMMMPEPGGSAGAGFSAGGPAHIRQRAGAITIAGEVSCDQSCDRHLTVELGDVGTLAGRLSHNRQRPRSRDRGRRTDSPRHETIDRLNGRTRSASSNAASAASHRLQAIHARARAAGSRPTRDRVRSIPLRPIFGRTAQPHQQFASLAPGRIVEDLDQALLTLQCQTCDHRDPGRHPLEVIGQLAAVWGTVGSCHSPM